jgi:tRNA/rRNA methyltransferase
MNTSGPLSRIRIVLSHPAHPGNIGAAARAMKTMGISRLYLVNPKKFPHPEARAMAPGALEVLESAHVCATLDEALEGTTFSIAMSARRRELSHAPFDARTAAREITAAAEHGEAALVFGTETVGLANEEVMKCTRLAHIPANPENTSLNLAQAVQVMAYETRLALFDGTPESKPVEYARHEDIEAFYAHLERSLHGSGFLHPKSPHRLMERMRRLFARARLEKEEVNILRGMLAAWDGENWREKK